MHLIKCPWCGERDEVEFSYGGEAHVLRPLTPDALSDDEFADYLFMKQNQKGLFLERWRHAAGCRQWFNMARNTYTHEIAEIYKMGELPQSAGAKAAYEENWRRTSAAELNAKDGAGS